MSVTSHKKKNRGKLEPLRARYERAKSMITKNTKITLLNGSLSVSANKHISTSTKYKYKRLSLSLSGGRGGGKQ